MGAPDGGEGLRIEDDALHHLPARWNLLGGCVLDRRDIGRSRRRGGFGLIRPIGIQVAISSHEENDDECRDDQCNGEDQALPSHGV